MIKIQDKYNEPINEVKVESESQIETQASEDDIIITEDAPPPIIVTPPTSQTQDPVQQTNESIKNKVKALSDIAFEQGLDEAIEEAKKLNDPYILDEFHDALTDNFYKKLVEAGKLEQR